MSKTLSPEIESFIKKNANTSLVPLENELQERGMRLAFEHVQAELAEWPKRYDDAVQFLQDRGAQLVSENEKLRVELDSVKEDRGFWKKEAMLHSDAREQLKSELSALQPKPLPEDVEKEIVKTSEEYEHCPHTGVDAQYCVCSYKESFSYADGARAFYAKGLEAGMREAWTEALGLLHSEGMAYGVLEVHGRNKNYILRPAGGVK